MDRRPFYGRGQQPHGFTLVELLVSAAILSVLFGVASTILLTAVRSSDHDDRERVQKMQIALNQIGEDMSHGNWVTDCTLGPCNAPPAPFQQCDTARRSFMTFEYSQPAGTTGTGPRYLTGVSLLRVRYTIERPYSASPVSTLTREVFEQAPYSPEKAYLREVLATDLVTCERILKPDGSSEFTGSYLNYDGTKFEVVLSTSPQRAGGVGGDPSAQTSIQGTWFIR